MIFSNGPVHYMKQKLDSDERGQPNYFYSPRLNGDQLRSDVNARWNLAPHNLRILLYPLDGELPARITARSVGYLQPGIEEVKFATLTLANSMMAHVSWLDPGKVTLTCSPNMMRFDDLSDDKVAIRRARAAAHFDNLLKDSPNIIELPQVRPGARHIYRVYCVWVQDHDALNAHLSVRPNAARISPGIHDRIPLPFLKMYRYLEHEPSYFRRAWSNHTQLHSRLTFSEIMPEQKQRVVDVSAQT